jgi:hypothetical protein
MHGHTVGGGFHGSHSRPNDGPDAKGLTPQGGLLRQCAQRRTTTTIQTYLYLSWKSVSWKSVSRGAAGKYEKRKDTASATRREAQQSISWWKEDVISCKVVVLRCQMVQFARSIKFALTSGKCAVLIAFPFASPQGAAHAGLAPTGVICGAVAQKSNWRACEPSNG